METTVYRDHQQLDETHWWFLGRRSIIADVLSRLDLSIPAHWVDIGSGSGGMLEALFPYGEVTAVEGDRTSAESIRKRFRERVRVVQAFVNELPELDATIISFFDVLEHIGDDVATLRDMYARLPPGGLLICTVPAFSFLWSDHDVLSHHVRRYRKSDLVGKLRTAGFEVQRCTYFNFFLFPIIVPIRFLFNHMKRRSESDFHIPSFGINRILTNIFRSERYVLRHVDFPFGVSLLAIARKPEVI